MSEPHIVTPKEAQEMMRGEGTWQRDDDMAYTIATEPERTRAAVVEALRLEAGRAAKAGNVWAAEWNDDAADNYEGGARV